MLNEHVVIDHLCGFLLSTVIVSAVQCDCYVQLPFMAHGIYTITINLELYYFGL